MNAEDRKWSVGESWLMVAVVIICAWAAVISVAVAFLRVVAGTHTSWAWAIAPVGLAGGLVLAYLLYRAIFAPPYSPELYEHREFHDQDEKGRDAPTH